MTLKRPSILFLLLFGIITTSLFSQKKGVNETIPFSYTFDGDSGQVADLDGTVAIQIYGKNGGILEGSENVFDFKGERKGVVKIVFSDLQWDKGYVGEGLGFNINYFSSSPSSKFSMPKGTTILKAGKRPVDITVRLPKDGSYSFTVGFGVIMKPGTPPVRVVKEAYTINAVGIGSVADAQDLAKLNIQSNDGGKEDGEKEIEIKVEEASADDQKAWDEAKSINTPDSYLAYLDRYKYGFYSGKARERLLMDAFVQPKARNFYVGVFLPNFDEMLVSRDQIRIDSIVGKDRPLRQPPEISWKDDTLVVRVNDFTAHEVHYTNLLINRKATPVVIDPNRGELKVTYTDTKGKDAIKLKIEGGTPPFSLTFVRKENGVIEKHSYSEVITRRETKLDKGALVKAMGLEKGNYFIDVRDDAKIRKAGKTEIFIQPPPLIPLWLWILFGLLLIFFLIFAIIRRNQKKQADEELAVLVAQKKEYQAMTADEKIKIKGKAKKNMTKEELLALTAEERAEMEARGEYKEVAMESFWEDSSVSKVMLEKDFILGINDFVKRHAYNEDAEEEFDDVVPEIGGFIMGHWDLEEATETYEVRMEKFVPITPEAHDRYHIVFGNEAWLELAEAQDKNPEMKMIGWFHTHPGHGLFLSLPDQKIQEAHFREPYQVAVVMDPLEPNLDTAFFTRKNTGRMNNAEDLEYGADWFNWQELIDAQEKQGGDFEVEPSVKSNNDSV